MTKTDPGYNGPSNMTRDEFNASRRKHVYPDEKEVAGGPLSFIKVHSPEPMNPRGRLLREWTLCESKLGGGCKSGHLMYFVELEDGTFKRAMKLIGPDCGENAPVEKGEKDDNGGEGDEKNGRTQDSGVSVAAA